MFLAGGKNLATCQRQPSYRETFDEVEKFLVNCGEHREILGEAGNSLVQLSKNREVKREMGTAETRSYK